MSGGMKLVTGNDLISGAVTWWTGTGWSRFIADAIDAGADGDAIVAREEAAQRVNTAYVVEAVPGPGGPILPSMKQRIRAEGPSVHPQFAVLRDAASTGPAAPQDERVSAQTAHPEAGSSIVEGPSRSTPGQY